MCGYPNEYSQEEYIRSKNLSQLKVEEFKTLTLDVYRDILNIGPLGEGVPFYVIVFCSIANKNNYEWEIRDHNRGV
jgi:hypothetical protein